MVDESKALPLRQSGRCCTSRSTDADAGHTPSNSRSPPSTPAQRGTFAAALEPRLVFGDAHFVRCCRRFHGNGELCCRSARMIGESAAAEIQLSPARRLRRACSLRPQRHVRAVGITCQHRRIKGGIGDLPTQFSANLDLDLDTAHGAVSDQSVCLRVGPD